MEELWDLWYEKLAEHTKKRLQKDLTLEKAEAQARKMGAFFFHKFGDGYARVFIKRAGNIHGKTETWIPYIKHEPKAWVYDEIGHPIGEYPLTKAFEMVNGDNDWTIGDIS